MLVFRGVYCLPTSSSFQDVKGVLSCVVHPPGNDHISHQKGKSENHRLKSAGNGRDICDRVLKDIMFLV